MANLSDMLFGSSGESVASSKLMPFQAYLLRDIGRFGAGQMFAPGTEPNWLEQQAKLYGQLQPQGVSAYGGPMVAPMSSLEQQGLQQIGQGIPQAYGQGATAMGRMLDPAANMQYWNQAFEPMQENIANRFASVGGARSSGMMQALGRGYGQSIIPQVMGQQQSALGMVPQMAQLPQQMGMGMMAAGEIPRNIQQNQMLADYEKWLHSQPYNNPWMRTGMQAAGIPGIEVGYQQGSSGLMGGLAQGAGMGAGMWGMSKLMPLLAGI